MHNNQIRPNNIPMQQIRYQPQQPQQLKYVVQPAVRYVPAQQPQMVQTVQYVQPARLSTTSVVRRSSRGSNYSDPNFGTCKKCGGRYDVSQLKKIGERRGGTFGSFVDLLCCCCDNDSNTGGGSGGCGDMGGGDCGEGAIVILPILCSVCIVLISVVPIILSILLIFYCCYALEGHPMKPIYKCEHCIRKEKNRKRGLCSIL